MRLLARERGCWSVLDYGAGKGALAEALAGSGLDVRCYDPVTFPEPPEPADLVVCTDVMCFVDDDQVDDVLAHIRSLALKNVFFAVPLHPEHKAGPGLTRRPLDEWRDILDRYWPIRSAWTARWGNRAPEETTPRLVFIGRTENS